MLRIYLSSYTNISWDVLWESMTDVVRKTILMAYPSMLKEYKELKYSSHYKLLGLDLMLDTDLRVWLLEVGSEREDETQCHVQVNTDPHLHADPVDQEMKSRLISEMFNIVGFQIPEVEGRGLIRGF